MNYDNYIYKEVFKIIFLNKRKKFEIVPYVIELLPFVQVLVLIYI